MAKTPILNPPLCARGAVRGPGDGAVDHLDAVGRALGLVQGVQDHVPAPGLGPLSELAINGRPGAEAIRQVPPRRAGLCDPEHAVQDRR